MNLTFYVVGIFIQLAATLVALRQVRMAARRLPWLLISLASLLMVVRRVATLQEIASAGGALVPGELLTFLVSVLFFAGVLMMDRLFLDIMASKRAVEDSETRHRELFEHLRDAAFLADAETGIILDANRRAEALLGRPRSEIIGLHQTRLHAPDQAEKYREDFANQIKTEGAKETRGEVIRADGAIVPVSIIVSVLSVGGRRCALGLFHDLTDLERAEEALYIEGRKYRTIVENIHDALYIHDFKGRIIDVNERACEMLGYRKDELVGASLSKIDAEKDARLFAERTKELMERGAVVFDGEHVRKDGRRVFVNISAKIVSTAGDGIVHGFARDITERKQAEEEKARLEAQIRQTQKLESLGVLAGGIAHDFNNILVAVLGNADLAIEELPPGSSARPMIAEIEKAARRAADLCRQMLAYSGKGRFVVERVNMSEIVQEMARMLEVSISKKAVLNYDCPKTLPAIEADPGQMRQIVMNLIINASEALGGKEGIITVSTGAVPREQAFPDDTELELGISKGQCVVLEVSDTGCGMDGETAAKIFDPFFTTKFTGRGLGLAAVQGIVRSHNGVIRVQSEPDKGTTFRIFLPALDVPAETTPEASPKTREWRGKGVVLLADDEESVRRTGGQMLKRLGFTILTAQDGQEAVDLFKQHDGEIVCVLLDLTMPRMDGLEAFEELKRLRPDLPIIVSSGYSEQDVTGRFAGQGLGAFIHKPYRMSELAQKFRALLG